MYLFNMWLQFIVSFQEGHKFWRGTVDGHLKRFDILCLWTQEMEIYYTANLTIRVEKQLSYW